MHDLIDFVRKHKPLTAAFIAYNAFAALVLTGHGFFRLGLYLLGFTLAFIWFTVFCGLSLLNSYTASRPRHGKSSRGKPWAGRDVARRGLARRGRDDHEP